MLAVGSILNYSKLLFNIIYTIIHNKSFILYTEIYTLTVSILFSFIEIHFL